MSGKVGGVKYWLLVAVLCLGGVAWGADARSAIEKAYAREMDAVRLHFVRGMLSIRAPGFQVLTADGRTVDLGGETARLQGLFDNALSAQETVTIHSFQLADPARAVCHIHDKIEFVRDARGEMRRTTVDTDSEDEWVNTPRGWRQKSVRIVRQRARTVALASPRTAATPGTSASPSSSRP